LRERETRMGDRERVGWERVGWGGSLRDSVQFLLASFFEHKML